MIAALFVESGGAYFGLDDVSPWAMGRDARNYRGPHPVVAHPPCKRWGRYWPGGPSVHRRKFLGDDAGCFAAALWAVRTFGGVIEHPEASHAWRWFGLACPPKSGGWIDADALGGSTCCVEQGHYGHPMRKATWLYAFGVDLPDLVWGPSEGRRADAGYRTREERQAAKALGSVTLEDRTPSAELKRTPPAFRDVLLAMAKTSKLRGEEEPQGLLL